MARTESLPDMPILEEHVPKLPSESSRHTKTKRHGHAKPVASNQRSHLELPVIVCGQSLNEEPLHEAARTLVVHPHGALIALDTTVVLGQELVLVNPKTKAEVACRVVGFESSRGGGKFSVEVEFSHSAAKFWGVLFPPENLDPAERKLPRSHRQHLRVECSEPVRIRPAEDSTDHTEDMCYTQNISRDGLYFTSGHPGYHEGMPLLIRFLKHLDPSSSDTDHLGQVARLDHGKDGRMGVAVKLLEPITWQTAYDGQGRVVVVRLRKGRRKSSTPAPTSVAEFTTPQMNDAPRTAQQQEKLEKTKSPVYFRPSILGPKLWRQLKGAIFLPRIRRIASAICRRARRWLMRSRKWAIGLSRIVSSRRRESHRVERASALPEQ
jgi:YD repeat-containing protein